MRHGASYKPNAPRLPSCLSFPCQRNVNQACLVRADHNPSLHYEMVGGAAHGSSALVLGNAWLCPEGLAMRRVTMNEKRTGDHRSVPVRPSSPRRQQEGNESLSRLCPPRKHPRRKLASPRHKKSVTPSSASWNTTKRKGGV